MAAKRRSTPGLRRFKDGGVWHLNQRIPDALGGGWLTGSTGTTNLPDARLILARRREEMRGIRIHGRRGDVQWSTVAEDYYRRHGSQLRSHEDVRRHIDALLPFVGKVPVSRIAQCDELQRFIAERQKLGNKSKSINLTLGTLRRTLTHAVETGALESAPSIRKLPERDNREPHVLTWDEQDRLLPLLPRWIADVCLVLLHTGMRMSEVTSARWEWYGERDGVSYLELPADATKTNERRVVPLNRVARRVLGTPEREGPIIIKPITRPNQTAWQNAKRKLGLDLHMHDLRHTAATRMREAGVEWWTIAAVLGHAVPHMTARYAHHSLAELAAAVAVLEERPGTAKRMEVV